jgi:hypothetical protein
MGRGRGRIANFRQTRTDPRPNSAASEATVSRRRPDPQRGWPRVAGTVDDRGNDQPQPPPFAAPGLQRDAERSVQPVEDGRPREHGEHGCRREIFGAEQQEEHRGGQTTEAQGERRGGKTETAHGPGQGHRDAPERLLCHEREEGPGHGAPKDTARLTGL